MAQNAITKAADTLRKINIGNKIQRVKDQVKEDEAIVTGCALAGAGAAGFVDAKWGTQWGDKKGSADFHGVPVNAALGAAGIALAIAKPDMPGRNVVGGIALGMACASLYRFTVDNVDFDEEAEAA